MEIAHEPPPSNDDSAAAESPVNPSPSSSSSSFSSPCSSSSSPRGLKVKEKENETNASTTSSAKYDDEDEEEEDVCRICRNPGDADNLAILAIPRLCVSVDYYDVSLVDGFNVPIFVMPINGRGNCTTVRSRIRESANSTDAFKTKSTEE